MMDETQRRPTTIVAADIAGLSRLVGVDEEAIHAAHHIHHDDRVADPLLSL